MINHFLPHGKDRVILLRSQTYSNSKRNDYRHIGVKSDYHILHNFELLQGQSVIPHFIWSGSLTFLFIFCFVFITRYHLSHFILPQMSFSCHAFYFMACTLMNRPVLLLSILFVYLLQRAESCKRKDFCRRQTADCVLSHSVIHYQ